MNAKRHSCLPAAIVGFLLVFLTASRAEEIAPAPSAANIVIGNHPGWIGGVAFNRDGTGFAVASADNTASIHSIADGKPLARFRGHTDYVVAVAFSPDSKLLATASYDHTARLWDIATQKTKHELKGHAGVVMSVAFSPDGKTLATGSIDRTVMLWDTATGKKIATLQGHRSWVNAVAYSPDGTLIATGSSDGTVRLWDAKTHELKQVRVATKSEVRSLAFSRQGHLAAGLRYGMVRTWVPIHDIYKEHLHFQAHKADVFAITFSHDGKTLITGNGDWNQPGQVNLWNAADGKAITSLATTGEVLSLAASPDGKTIIAGTADKKVFMWDTSKLAAKAEINPVGVLAAEKDFNVDFVWRIPVTELAPR